MEAEETGEAEETRDVEIAASDVGQRLDRLLADRLGISRARVRHLLEVGRVEGEGRPLELGAKSHRVAAGERFRISGALHAEAEQPVPRPDLDPRIVAQGSGWLAVDKPAGVGVHPLRPDQTDTVLNALVARHPEIVGVGEAGLRSGVVHRLDVDTSGALLFATESAAWRRLRGAFADHRVDKRYRAIVVGRFEAARRVVLPLSIARHRPAHVRVDDAGRPCRQRVSPLLALDGATLVEVELETGFLHQIRATMAHLGHPVLGDAAYGGDVLLAGHRAPRPMLHARRVAFDEIVVEVEPPEDFAGMLEALAVDPAAD